MRHKKKLKSKFLNIKDGEMFAAFIISVFLGLAYLLWRALFTIDYTLELKELIWPMMLIVAETYSFIVFAIFAFASINIRKYRLRPHLKDDEFTPSVDIFICTYNENESILQDTIMGCKNIDYNNKKIYLLDDGHRPHIEKLANDLGINYIKRDNNKGFKAGNINNALQYTNGELIAIFDADHVPVSTFLLEIVDYFKDKKTAIVQTPQHFMNPDPFQKNLIVGRPKTNEQDLFFRVIQPGLSRWNAAICAGTNFIVRRKPLMKIGGIPHNTVTEDMDLGLRMRKLGLYLKYHNKPLAVGLAPEDFKGYVSQRLRWAAGTIQIFLFNRKIFLKSLNMPQKIFFFSGILYYFFGFPRLIFLMSPILYLLFNIKPLSASLYIVGAFLALCYVSKMYFFRKVAKDYRSLIFTDIYETAICFYLSLGVIKTLLHPKNIKFSITSKGVNDTTTDIMMFLPQAIILGFAIASFIIPIYNLYEHIYSLDALIINLLLNLINSIILIFSIKVALEKPEFRKNRRIPTQVEANLEDQTHNKVGINVLNLSKKGALVFAQTGDKGFEDIQGETFLVLPEVEKINIQPVNIYKTEKGSYYHCKFNMTSPKMEYQVLKLAFKNSNSW